MNSTKANSLDTAVMVIVLAASVIDHGIKLRSDQTKVYKIDILLLLCKAHSIKL